MEMSGCQFLTAASAKKLPSRKDEVSNVIIECVDAHDLVMQFCRPAFDAVKSFMENTCVNVYHK